MYPQQYAEKISDTSEDMVDTHLFQVGVELEKKNQFLHFLQKELSAARTETEKEAVVAILLKTKIQIRALERELKNDHDSLRTPKPISLYFHPAFRTRRLQ